MTNTDENKGLLEKRPTEIAASAVGLLVAAGVLTLGDGEVLKEAVIGLTLLVASVTPVVTGLVTRFRDKA